MKRISILLLIFFTCLVSAAWPQSEPQWRHRNIITFDVLGAGTGSGQGTVPYGITASGVIIGYYTDENNLNHAFFRTPDGYITTFDAPNAAAPVILEGLWEGTMALSTNAVGLIVGIYMDDAGVVHGFLRSPLGRLETFDAPNAGTGSGQGTWICNINDAGTFSGAYIDSANRIHAYQLTGDGRYTVFEAPGAGTGTMQGTDNPTMYGLNAAGVMAG